VPAGKAVASISVAGSNPVTPTRRDKKPFGENVEGLSYCGDESCVIKAAVQKDDFEDPTFCGVIGGRAADLAGSGHPVVGTACVLDFAKRPCQGKESGETALQPGQQPRQIRFTSTSQYMLASWVYLSLGLIGASYRDGYLFCVLNQTAASIPGQ
jgi:hypothetical protein